MRPSTSSNSARARRMVGPLPLLGALLVPFLLWRECVELRAAVAGSEDDAERALASVPRFADGRADDDGLRRIGRAKGRALRLAVESSTTEDAPPRAPSIPPPPGRNEHNFTVAICAIAKDAEAYVTEWIDYHLLAAGFDRIYIYDNSDGFELERWHNNTRSHPAYSRVVVRSFPGQGWLEEHKAYVQRAAYKDCVRRYGVDPHGPQIDYFALIDLDEFVVLRQFPANHTTIHDVLAEYLVPYGGALTMNWMIFGTANRTVYSPVPVLKRFQYREPTANKVVKSIVRARDFDDVRNPHAVSLRGDASVRTTSYPGAVHREANQTGRTGSNDGERPSDVLLLHHVRYTSVKEYTFKRCSRGEALGDVRGCDTERGELLGAAGTSGGLPEHIFHRPGAVLDSTAWDFLTAKVLKYKVFDEDDWEDFF